MMKRKSISHTPWRLVAKAGAAYFAATLLLVGCASEPPDSRLKSSSITSPLVADVYRLERTTDSRLIATLIWPERFGKEVQSISLHELNLDKAKITEVPGGLWATNYQVDIPTINQRRSVQVTTWPPDASEMYSRPSQESDQSDQLTFYSPNRNAARQTIRILKLWQ